MKTLIAVALFGAVASITGAVSTTSQAATLDDRFVVQDSRGQ